MSEDSSGMIQGAAGGASSGAKVGGPWGALIGAVVGAGVGLGAGQNTKRARVNLENTITEYMNQLKAIDMPRYEDLKLSLERYSKGEDLTPDQLQALQELDNEVSKLSYDKTAKQTQLDALAALKARSRGGLTLQDKADLMNAQKEIDRSQQGVQKSIIQNMQSRGVGGAGVELAQRMGAAQMGTQQASQNALNVAANAQNRAMAALKESAQMGRQMGQDQLNLDQTKAQSLDDMRRKNLERLQQSMQYNVGSNNQAKQLNWNRANTTSDKNTDMSNTEQKYNKDLLMQDYKNQIDRLNLLYKGDHGEITQKEGALDRRKQEQAGYMDMINSVGNMGGGMSSMGGGGSGGGGGGGFMSMFGGGSSTGGGNYNFGADDFQAKYGSQYGGGN